MSSSQLLVVVVDSVGIFHILMHNVVFGNLLGDGISSRTMVLHIHFRILVLGWCIRCGIVALCILYRILGMHLFRNV